MPLGKGASSNIRNKPILDKKTDERVIAGHYTVSASMQGWRRNMEDSHSASELHSGIGLYAVFDGHGGEEVALFVAKHLPEQLVNLPADIASEGTEEEIVRVFCSMDNLMLESAVELHKTTHSARKNRGSTHKLRVLEVRKDKPDEDMDVIHGEVVLMNVGCTGTVAFIQGNRLLVANVGDSRATLARDCTQDGGCHAQDMSRDHSLKDPEEAARVVASGHEVNEKPGGVDPPRIDNELAVARSFGDTRFKKSADLPPEAQAVSVYPEIMHTELREGDDFLVIACDGIFEVMRSEDVVEFVHRSLLEGLTPLQVVTNLLDNCIAPISEGAQVGTDNMTAMIVMLNKERYKVPEAPKEDEAAMDVEVPEAAAAE